ncbi:plasmid SOS inhibition protein A [Enterobacter sp.]|uniref:plasmid SOS inhibition protein A n=1 Tax=Enterobacter sp. TaxID=42895 RepID=UPI00296F3219|nr:plasmid SOS inhibition protein A [Enterobacter sp.]
MIPSGQSLVTLQPARQAALRAIAEVEQRQESNRRLPSENPHARAFMRHLTGSSRINTRSAQQIPGLAWDPSFKIWSLKTLEDELDRLLRSHGEYCCSPLSREVQQTLFPDVVHRQNTRHDRRSKLNSGRTQRREDKRLCHETVLRQNLTGQARLELNFHSPETVKTWYTRWADELNEGELARLFWSWWRRFHSLKELEWNSLSGDPMWAVLFTLQQIVEETPEHTRQAERWQVPNKLRDMRDDHA